MPQTAPDGVVSHVWKSPWASNQTRPSRMPGRAARMPAIAAGWIVHSPPRSEEPGVGAGVSRARP